MNKDHKYFASKIFKQVAIPKILSSKRNTRVLLIDFFYKNDFFAQKLSHFTF